MSEKKVILRYLAQEGDDSEGWFDAVWMSTGGELGRWFKAWKPSGANVEAEMDLGYNDEKAWVEKKRNAQALLDLCV